MVDKITDLIKKPWYIAFNHRYKVILFMYLMHRPDCSKGIQKAFTDKKIKPSVNEKAKSLKQTPNIKKLLIEMQQDNLIYEIVPDKKEFNRSKYYSINPNVFADNYYHEDISNPTDTDMIDEEVEILNLIVKLSPGRYELVNRILKYEKFDYITVLLHYKKLVELLDPDIIESGDTFFKPIKEHLEIDINSEIEGIEDFLKREVVLEHFGNEDYFLLS